VTYNQVHKILPIAFSDLGAQQVKNIDEPIHAFETVSSDQRTERFIDFARHGFPPPLPDKPSIAVLPFQNMSGDPEQEYFADGVVEEITTALSRFKSLFVIARNSSFTHKGKAVDVRKVGQELGVRYVLEGSVRKGSGRIRVAAQLVEAASGAHLWADKFDATLEDVFETQDNLTLSVVAAIAPKILEIEARSVDRKRDLNSYDRYLRAMALYYQYTTASLREAYGEARKAIAANASFGVAYAQAASCLHNLKFNHGVQLTDAEFAEMISLITTALQLANDDERVLALAAEIFSMERQEYERGLALADSAIALNSNWTSAWTARGWCTLSLGQFAEAFEGFAKGLRLNPIDRFPVYGPLRGLASTSAMARRYDEAMSWADKLLARRPNDLMALALACDANVRMNKIEDASLYANRFRAAYPELRNPYLRQNWRLFRRPEDLARADEIINSLGLPE
jgi:adenylate cyclase